MTNNGRGGRMPAPPQQGVQMTKQWKFAVVAALVLGAFAALSAVLAPGEVAVPRGYQCDVYTEQGCAKYVVASGGELEVQSGGILDVQSGATFAPTLSGDITFVNGTTLGEAVDTVLDLSEFLAFTAQTAVSITEGAIITPTGTYQPLTSAAAVTTSTSCAIYSGTVKGQLLVLTNENASDAIIIDDGANTNLGGNKTLTGGEGDGLYLMWDEADWFCIGYNDN